jgi:hypothetical protein
VKPQISVPLFIYFFFWCFFMVSIGGGVGTFVPVVVERGMLQVLGAGKACQQDLLRSKDRSVLPGINHLKNALRPFIVEVYLKITN